MICTRRQTSRDARGAPRALRTAVMPLTAPGPRRPLVRGRIDWPLLAFVLLTPVMIVVGMQIQKAIHPPCQAFDEAAARQPAAPAPPPESAVVT